MYVHSGIFFSRKKEKELPPFVATWVGLGGIKRHKMSEDRRPVTSHVEDRLGAPEVGWGWVVRQGFNSQTRQ